MRLFKILPYLLCLILGLSLTAAAQEIDESDLNPNSVRPVRPADIMYKKTVWLRMDLREKLNTPMFAKNQYITKVIIDAVKSNLLRPFRNDSLETRLSYQEFLERIKQRNVEADNENVDDGFGGGGGWGNDSWGNAGGSNAANAGVDEEIDASRLHLIDLKVDVLFDRKRSMWINDIQAVTIVLPAELNGAKAVEEDIASFSYKELVDNLFNYKEAIWYNDKNTSENRNLAQAFDLALYNARVTKYTDAKARDITTIYQDINGNAGFKSLIKGQDFKYGLVDYENNLWSN